MVASLLISALVSGSSGPGSGPGLGHCVMFLGKTLAWCINGTGELTAGGDLAMD